jgi:hypothetical protein
MKKQYKIEVLRGLSRTSLLPVEILSETDITHLPRMVRKYLYLTGMVGKEKIRNFRVEFKGGIRSKPADEYMPLKSVQYNFTDQPSRFFYIVAWKMGIPAKGIHVYKDQKATMLIKLLGLFTISDAKGKEMDQGETVTLFNDMCFMAPGTLIDENIKWTERDPLTVDAKFTNGDIEISATLIFKENGELIDFISNDRYETTDGRTFYNYQWRTPVSGYKEINGFFLPAGAKAIYRHPEGDFCYGEFNLVSVEYNCRGIR